MTDQQLNALFSKHLSDLAKYNIKNSDVSIESYRSQPRQIGEFTYSFVLCPLINYTGKSLDVVFYGFINASSIDIDQDLDFERVSIGKNQLELLKTHDEGQKAIAKEIQSIGEKLGRN